MAYGCNALSCFSAQLVRRRKLNAMLYEITRAYQEGRPLTAKQRSSSLFSDHPTIGSRTLRRGSPPIILSEQEMEILSSKLKRLVDAEAIRVRAIELKEPTSQPAQETPTEIKEPTEALETPEEPNPTPALASDGPAIPPEFANPTGKRRDKKTGKTLYS